jgi:hypothetical protein
MNKRFEQFKAGVTEQLARIDAQVAFETDYSRSLTRHVVVLRKVIDQLTTDLISVAEITLDDGAITLCPDGKGLCAPLGMQREEIIKVLEAAIVTAEDGEQADRKTVQTITQAEAE